MADGAGFRMEHGAYRKSLRTGEDSRGATGVEVGGQRMPDRRLFIKNAKRGTGVL